MIGAAKADGQIDQAEMQKMVGRLANDTVTAEEKQFVLDQMAAPVDINALAARGEEPDPGCRGLRRLADRDQRRHDAERAYLADLARALRLSDATVAELHRMTGAPT